MKNIILKVIYTRTGEEDPKLYTDEVTIPEEDLLYKAKAIISQQDPQISGIIIQEVIVDEA